MAKFNKKIKNNREIIIVKFSSREQVIDAEMNYLNNLRDPMFLQAEHVKKGVVNYFPVTTCTLSRFLTYKLLKKDFYHVIEQILDAEKKIKSYGLLPDKLLLDPEYIFVNENNADLYFTYITAVNIQPGPMVPLFIGKVAAAMAGVPALEGDYANKFMNFLRTQSAYDPESLRQYIKNDLPGVNAAAANVAPNQTAAPGSSGFITNKRAEYYEHYQSQSGNPARYAETGIMEDEYGTEETSLLMEEDYGAEETTLLEEPVVYPTLTRLKTGETVDIDKPSFRIGKERNYVDYCVTENPAVSRSHADIISSEGLYFINDLGSTNRTFINGVPIPANTQTQISDGDIIKLADEEFEFHAF